FGQAKIENRAILASIGAGAHVKADSLVLDAHATDNIYLIVVAGSFVSGTAAIAGSIGLQGITGTIDATVGTGAVVNVSGAAGGEITTNHGGQVWVIAGAISVDVRAATQQGQQQANNSNSLSATISAGASAAITDTGTDVRSRATGASIDATGG